MFEISVFLFFISMSSFQLNQDGGIWEGIWVFWQEYGTEYRLICENIGWNLIQRHVQNSGWN